MSIYVDLEKTVGTFSLNVQFEAGNETLALLGASGCGKSMTLKCIAGIEKPNRGRIVVDGVTVFDSERRINLPPQRRRTGLMFQSYALFPNMTVAENIRAGTIRKGSGMEREAAVATAVERFQLNGLERRLPHQLSGGQQQRVALARMMVSDPTILLLDEPFSALDSHLRFCMEQDVRQAIRTFGKTVLLVSHDRDEVFRMSDKVAVMENGRISVLGSACDVFSAPQTIEAARLTGCRFISSIQRLGANRVYATEWGIELTIPFHAGQLTAVGIRAQDIRPGPGENGFRCLVVDQIEEPFSHTLLLRPENASAGRPFGWLVPRGEWEQTKSSEVEIHIPREKILLLGK